MAVATDQPLLHYLPFCSGGPWLIQRYGSAWTRTNSHFRDSTVSSCRQTRLPSSNSVIIHGLPVGVTAHDFVLAAQQYQIGRVLRATDSIVGGSVTIKAAFADADAACRAVAAWDSAVMNGALLSVKITPAFVLDEKESILIPHTFTVPTPLEISVSSSNKPSPSPNGSQEMPHPLWPILQCQTPPASPPQYLKRTASRNQANSNCQVHSCANANFEDKASDATLSPSFAPIVLNTARMSMRPAPILVSPIHNQASSRASSLPSTPSASSQCPSSNQFDYPNSTGSSVSASESLTANQRSVKQLFKKAERRRVRSTDDPLQLAPECAPRPTQPNVPTYTVDPLQGKRKWDLLLSSEALRAREERDARYREVVDLGLSAGRTKRQWARARKPGKREREEALRALQQRNVV